MQKQRFNPETTRQNMCFRYPPRGISTVTGKPLCRVCGKSCFSKNAKTCSRQCSELLYPIASQNTWPALKQRLVDKQKGCCAQCHADMMWLRRLWRLTVFYTKEESFEFGQALSGLADPHKAWLHAVRIKADGSGDSSFAMFCPACAHVVRGRHQKEFHERQSNRTVRTIRPRHGDGAARDKP